MKQYSKQILLFLLYLLIFGISYHLFSNLCYYDTDDLNSTIAPYPLLQEENGRYVFNILSRVVCIHIPNLFNIHIQDALTTIGNFTYAMIQLLLFSIIGAFSCFKSKKIGIYTLFFAFAALCFYNNYVLNFNIFFSTIVSYQYGYAMATAAAIGFLAVVYFYIINEKTPSDKVLFFICIIGFCAGNSTQFMSYSVALTLFFLGLFLLKLQNFDFKKAVDILKNKSIFLPVCSFFAGLTLMVLSPGFWNEVSWRHAKSVQEVLETIPVFVKEYINVVFINQCKIWVLLIILVLSVLVLGYLKKEFKKYLNTVIIAILPVFSGLCYFATLILAGKTFPGIGIVTWVNEPFYTFCWLMTTCAVIAMLFGILVNNISSLKAKRTFYSVTIIFLLFTAGLPNVSEYDNRYNNLKFLRKDIYKAEKIIYFYATKTEQNEIIIPDFDFNQIHWPTYFEHVYGIELKSEPVKIDYDEAIEKFKQLGGKISEFETDKPRFKNISKQKTKVKF